MSEGNFLVRQVAAAGSGDDTAYQWLESRMKPILSHGVRYYAPTPMEYPDRWQVARIALFRAAQSYDYRRGRRFTAFLTEALKHAYTGERRRYAYRAGRARFVSYDYLEIETGEEGVPDPGPDRFSTILLRAFLAAVFSISPPDVRVQTRLDSIAQGVSIETAAREHNVSHRAAQMAFLRWRKALKVSAPHLFEERP